MSIRKMVAAFGPRFFHLLELERTSAASGLKSLPQQAYLVLHRQQGCSWLAHHSRTKDIQIRSYSQCSCPGMDKLPSNRLFVEYNPEEVDRFIEVADAVEDAFPGLVVEGVEAVEGAHTFAVKMEDGTVIFAHSGQGNIPGNEELIGHIRAAGAGESP